MDMGGGAVRVGIFPGSAEKGNGLTGLHDIARGHENLREVGIVAIALQTSIVNPDVLPTPDIAWIFPGGIRADHHTIGKGDDLNRFAGGIVQRIKIFVLYEQVVGRMAAVPVAVVKVVSCRSKTVATGSADAAGPVAL